MKSSASWSTIFLKTGGCVHLEASMKADADSSVLLESRLMVRAKRREIVVIGAIKEIAPEVTIAALFMQQPKRAAAKAKRKVVLPVAVALQAAKVAAKERKVALQAAPIDPKGVARLLQVKGKAKDVKW